MRPLITSAGSVAGRSASSGTVAPPVHDGRRYTTYSQSGREIYIRDHPLFRSGLTSVMGGFRDDREWRSVGADAEVITARKDLDSTVFGPGWTLRTNPQRAGYPAAILLRRFVAAWLQQIRLPLLYLLPDIAAADFEGWSIVEIQRGRHFLFDGRPYDVPLGFRTHAETEHFSVATDGSLVFQDIGQDQVFAVAPGERFIVHTKGLGAPYGSKPTAGEVWYLWQLKKAHEKQQSRGIEQSIKGTPLFDAADLTDAGASEGELSIAEDKLRQALELIASTVEEYGILCTVGGLKYSQIVPAGKASDWTDLLKGVNDAIRRIVIGETLTAKDSNATGNRADGDGARVSRVDRARTYAGPPEAVVQEQLIRATCERNFPGVDPQDIPELQLRFLHPVSLEYLQAFLGWEGAEVDGEWVAEAFGVQVPHAGTKFTLRGGGPAPALPSDPLALSPDPRALPGQGTAEGVQLSRIPQRVANRAREILQQDAQAIQAGAEGIEAEGSEGVEQALGVRLRSLRDAVKSTADPETGSPKA